jgi:hypothetical protein
LLAAPGKIDKNERQAVSGVMKGQIGGRGVVLYVALLVGEVSTRILLMSFSLQFNCKFVQNHWFALEIPPLHGFGGS